MTDCYCVLSDIGMATQTNGHVSMCNQSRVFWQNQHGGLITLDKDSLGHAWQSPTRQNIRQSLLNGDQHENCQDCWNEEAAGRQSLRQIHNARFAAVEANPNQPRAIILKPGNLCNLACRHCNPHTSTAWYRDYYRIESQGYASLGEFAQQFNGAKNSYAESNEIWQTLRDWTDDIIFWDLYGAEPMLIKPLIDVLKNASYTAAAAQQSIHINTNGTVWQDDFAELFNRFGSVDIGVSIDGIERQFDYMRYPARWCEIQENLHRYQQLNNASIKVSICITVSLLNVYYLPEYLDYFRSQGWHVGTNLVHGPDHLNMRIADPATKSAILDKLSGHAELDDICKFIQLDWHDAQSDIEKFFDITRSYDRIRGESYTEVFPEFAKILEQSHADCWQ